MKSLFGKDKGNESDTKAQTGAELGPKTEENKQDADSHEQADFAQKQAEIAEREAALAASEAKAAEREKKLMQREVESDVKSLVSVGKVIPKQQSVIQAIAMHLKETNAQIAIAGVEEDEDQTLNAYDALIDVLGSNVKQIEFEEISKTGNEPAKADFDDPTTMAKVLVKVQEKEKCTSDEALVFIKQNGIPPYAVPTTNNGE